jgi:hypothetical protein
VWLECPFRVSRCKPGSLREQTIFRELAAIGQTLTAEAASGLKRSVGIGVSQKT